MFTAKRRNEDPAGNSGTDVCVYEEDGPSNAMHKVLASTEQLSSVTCFAVLWYFPVVFHLWCLSPISNC